MQSYPPQCGGAPIVNWNWDLVADEESAVGVIWGSYHLTGRYDGDRFSVIDVSTSDPTADPVDDDGSDVLPTRRLPLRELRRIAFYLSGRPAEERFGFLLLWSDIDREDQAVELGVDRSTRRVRRALARRYGRGVVRLSPQLHLVRRG